MDITGLLKVLSWWTAAGVVAAGCWSLLFGGKERDVLRRQDEAPIPFPDIPAAPLEEDATVALWAGRTRLDVRPPARPADVRVRGRVAGMGIGRTEGVWKGYRRPVNGTKGAA